VATRAFIACDAHPAKGGPHQTIGLVVGKYFDHPALVVMCTHRSKRGNVCGALMLVLDEKEDKP
jgi:hypothetical protein